MLSIIKQWDISTKIFAVLTLCFVLPTVLTGIYCYARLDFVRSYKSAPQTTVESLKP